MLPKRIFSQLNIGGVKIDAPVFLAPLAGITDRSYRQICREIGAGMVFTEMISADALIRDSEKSWNLALFKEEERPIGIQLFSHDPQTLGQAAALVETLQPDVIDINFGCPVRKVVRRGAGAGFMENLGGIAEAVRQVVANTKSPITVKLRSGPTADNITAVEAARRAEAEGASAITVHARTTSQVFRGKADWEVIHQVKAAVNIPVIGNGDIAIPDDMLEMFDQTGCDAVMIGRGCYGNPWIFSACKAVLENREWQPPEAEEKWRLIKTHLERVYADRGTHVGVREMRKHLGWYSKGLPGATQFRARVFQMENPEEVIKTCEQFFLRKNFSLEPEPWMKTR